MTRLELLTMLYSLKVLLDKELYEDAKVLINDVIAKENKNLGRVLHWALLFLAASVVS